MREYGPGVLFGVGVPASLLLAGSIALFFRERSASSFLQLLGAGGLASVVLTHFAEAFDLLPWMRWGLDNSPGHYLDLGSAALAVMLFPTGYLIYALRR